MAQEASLFKTYSEKYFSPLVGKITEKVNGMKQEETLLHKTMLVPEYSADLSWGTTTLNQSVVAADIVSMGSSLPLKKRGSVKSAQGALPKVGLKYKKDEKDISDIRITAARTSNEATVVAKIFDQLPLCVKGINVRNEISFQTGLSTGYALIENTEDNDGTGIRVKYGYKDEHIFVASVAWSATATNMTPQDDIQQMFDKAEEDGNVINHVWISKTYFNLFRKSKQGILLAAQKSQQVITDSTLLPVPSKQAFLDALEEEYGAKFHVISSAFKVQKPDGTTKSIRPWKAANIVGTPDEVVGRMVYGTLAEEDSPVSGVDYAKSGEYILLSKYSHNEPALEEITAGQALCLPVIDGAEYFYMLTADKTSADADTGTNDDNNASV